MQSVFFFVDPLASQPHDPDIRALLRVCNVHNVALATNVMTADTDAGRGRRHRSGHPPLDCLFRGHPGPDRPGQLLDST